MAYYTSKHFLCFIILFTSLNILNVRSDCRDLDDQYFVIRHVVSGLVLDASQVDTITLENPTHSENQQFKLSPSKTLGLFNIINKATGKAIEIIRSPDNAYYNATLTSHTDDITQQWFVNSEGTIISGGIINHALDIKDYVPTVGTRIIAWDRYDNDIYQNELFSFA